MRFAKSLRKGQIKQKRSVSNDLILLLDDVYDTFNVGGMYRVADAAGVHKIYHCGQTPAPPNAKISRAAIGLDQYISHEVVANIAAKIIKLQEQGYTVIALEQSKQAKLYDQIKYSGKIAVVVGNETFGVSKEALCQCDLVVELPMHGVNKSLNVVVATGIALYQMRKVLNL